MNLVRSLTLSGGALTMLGLVTIGAPVIGAQDATPQPSAAQGVAAPRPAHIHSGNCDELGDVVAPLVDLTGAQGEGQGQARRASAAESSFTNVPLPLDAILGADHAINVHLSAEEIDTYVACGEIGGTLTPEGALIVGLRELNDSGFTGVAFLNPAADGVSTDVSVFIADTQSRQRDRDRDNASGADTSADATPVAGA